MRDLSEPLNIGKDGIRVGYTLDVDGFGLVVDDGGVVCGICAGDELSVDAVALECDCDDN